VSIETIALNQFPAFSGARRAGYLSLPVSLVPAQIKEVVYLYDVPSEYLMYNVHVASSVPFTLFPNTPNYIRMCKLMIFCSLSD
jgi:hypothetical protein